MLLNVKATVQALCKALQSGCSLPHNVVISQMLSGFPPHCQPMFESKLVLAFPRKNALRPAD